MSAGIIFAPGNYRFLHRRRLANNSADRYKRAYAILTRGILLNFEGTYAFSSGSFHSTGFILHSRFALGALMGADLLNLTLLQELGAPVTSIDGARRFDGIFLTGLLAVLLA